MASVEIIFTANEIDQYFNYSHICETRYSNIWKTMKRKLMWDKAFSDIEKLKAEKIFCQAYKWMVMGVTNTVRMDFATYILWQKIQDFCYSL